MKIRAFGTNNEEEMRNGNYRKSEILEIKWQDTATACGWRSDSVLAKEKPVMCHSVGYFCAQNKNCITIVKCRSDDDGDGLDAQTIPKGCIKKITRIRK